MPVIDRIHREQWNFRRLRGYELAGNEYFCPTGAVGTEAVSVEVQYG